MSHLYDTLSLVCPHILTNEPMKNHTTFHIGGPADYVVFPHNLQELVAVLSWHEQNAPQVPMCILGKGSNVLFDDDGYAGLVIITTQMQQISLSPMSESVYQVKAECGVSLTSLAKLCGKHSPALQGLAFAYGIPGSVGGAVVMNAGAYGGEMSDVVVSVDYFDTRTQTLHTASKEAIDFAYRHSIFQDNPHLVVLSVTLQLPVGDSHSIQAEMTKNLTARQQKQPIDTYNAGSVFKRPEGAYVGQMVEACGLKGYTIGGAQVSPKHAGFIVNTGDATATHVLNLISHIQQVIFDTYHISLVCEIKHIQNPPKKR